MATVKLVKQEQVKSFGFDSRFQEAMLNDKKKVIITHRDCMDGYMCAYLASMLPGQKQIIMTSYGDNQEKDVGLFIIGVDVVIFADMTPSPVVFKKLVEAKVKIFIFDHHPNTKFSLVSYRNKENNSLVEDAYHEGYNYLSLFLNINYSKSGAYLLYETIVSNFLYLQSKGIDIEDFTRAFDLTLIVSDQDTHSLTIEGSQEFVGMVFSEIQTKATFADKLKVIDKYVDVANTYAQPGIELKHLTDYCSYADHKHFVEVVVNRHVDGAYCVDTTHLNGFVVSADFVVFVVFGHYDYRSQYLDAVLSRKWHNSDHLVAVATICPGKGVSIRSTGGSIALKLATVFGGGGHPNAAGIPIEKTVEFTNWALDWQINQ